QSARYASCARGTRISPTLRCALRTGEQDEQSFAQRVDRVLRGEGYRPIGAFLPGQAQAAAVAGFRVGHSLACGRYLYVDDLCVIPAARRQGHGGALLQWLLEE